MAIPVRRISAVLVGITVFCSLVFWSIWVGYGAIGAFVPSGLASSIEGMSYSRESVFYKKDHDIYTSLGFVLLSLSGGLTASLLIWNGSVPKKISLALVVVSLMVLLPLSAANYEHNDAFSTRAVQALINIPLAVLGTVAVISLYDFHLVSRTANILRIFAAAFIIMQGILIPIIYSTLWWLNFQNAISLAATRDFTPGWISAISGLAGFAFGLFKFFNEEKKDPVVSKRTIWLPGDPK